MKTRTKVLLSVAIVLAVIIAAAYLLPRQVHVERSKFIAQPASILFESVNNLTLWEGWSPWHKIDTAMEITYQGTEGTGASYTWKSNHKNVGNGTLTITESRPDEYIATTMDFGKQGSASAWYRFEPSDSGTMVTWGFDTDMGNTPIGRYMGLMMDKWIGADYEKGLDNLAGFAAKLEAQKREQVVVKFDTLKPITYAYVHTTCLNSEIGQKMGADYGTLMAFLEQAGVQMAGYPFATYEAFDSVQTTYNAGIPFAGALKGSDNIRIGNMAAAPAVVGYYYGPYEKLEKGHIAVQNFIASNGKKMTGLPMEIYITDPMAEKDTSRWLTQIWYPVN